MDMFNLHRATRRVRVKNVVIAFFTWAGALYISYLTMWSLLRKKSTLVSVPRNLAKEGATTAVFGNRRELSSGDIPSPSDWGWTETEGQWQPTWTSQPSIWDAARELVKCGCKNSCRGRCSCRREGMPCTLLCKSCNGNCHNSRIIRMRLEMSVIDEKWTGCEMPPLNPFSKEVMRYETEAHKVVCEGIDWVQCNKSECSVVKKILDNMIVVECYYKDIVYLNDKEYYIRESEKRFGREVYRLKLSDHVKVSCTGKKLHGSFLERFVPATWNGYKAGFRPVTPKTASSQQENNQNVLILGFGTASHNGFLRRMPKSYAYLSEELGAVVFKKYNVLGDGTPAALFPLLTGKTELELPDTRIRLNTSSKIDPKEFIFHTMKENGYRTAYFEDMPWIGTFQYRFNGFESQPADHYLRPLLMEETQDGAKWWKGLKNRYCMGATPQYAWMLNLTSQFFELDGKHFCFTMIADISRENFNLISTADDDLVDFLKQLRNEGRLENTLLIVLGDHGVRFTEVRNTFQGKIEERLPFLAVVLPEWLKEDKPDVLKTMKHNADEVLTTAFDVHATVLDFVGMHEKINPYKVPSSDIPRALSLLRRVSTIGNGRKNKIPVTRTCGEAGILPHWCACTLWNSVQDDDIMHHLAGNALADFINIQTMDHRSLCSKMTLVKILWVMRYGPNDEVLKYQGNLDHDSYLGKFGQTPVKDNVEYYQASIKMSPGEAIYEGSMTYSLAQDTFVVTDFDISRTDQYNEESHCIIKTHPHLDKFCYCRDVLGKTTNKRATFYNRHL